MPYYELYHHGIKGQRWGVRRFQEPDGSLTPAGKNRYYADKEYEEEQNLPSFYYNPYGRVMAKDSSYDNKPINMSRYQTHFEYTNKKKRIGYETTYDMLRKTAVGNKRKIQISKDGLDGKTLSVTKLSERDYKKAEEHLKNYETTLVRPTMHDIHLAKKWLKQHNIDA